MEDLSFDHANFLKNDSGFFYCETVGENNSVCGRANTYKTDLNGDEKMDIVATHYGGSNYAIWLEGDGAFGFTEHLIKDFSGTRPQIIRSLDVDKNGTMDLIGKCDYFCKA